MMTIHELVQGARDRFVSAGISATLATLDAEVLARQVLGWDRARFLADRNEQATSVFLLNYEPLVARRERREPVSYILGMREFWGLEFEVGPDVLIPRHETEFIVEEALALTGKDSHPLVMDVGTGSGCIAIVLAREIPGARVIATDVSRHALDRGPAQCGTPWCGRAHHSSSKPAFSKASTRTPTSSSRIPRMCLRCPNLA